MIHRLDLKIVLALVVTVLIPLGFSVYVVGKAIATSLGLGLNPEIAAQLEASLGRERERIKGIKDGIRTHFAALADSKRLFDAAASPAEDEVRRALAELTAEDPELRLLRLTGPGGRRVEAASATPAKPGAFRTVELGSDVSMGPYAKLEAVFAVDAAIFAAFEKAGAELATYQALVKAPPGYMGNRFVWAYLALLGFTLVFSIVVGVFWARRLARRIHRLAQATALVASGDLSVRVDPGSGDEVGRLVESFNGMVAELAVSRTRIEYLQKISAWQEMARRLAHEIKNPLTPIQLAAQQLKEKYAGGDPEFRRLLDQSTEIIQEEVATLRRLTSDFSAFAKLPTVKPELVDLQDFLGDCEASLAQLAEQEGARIEFVLPKEPIRLPVDRIMLKRVIDNLVRNALEALSGTGVADRLITVRAMRAGSKKRKEIEIRVSDNGPGVLPEHHASIFDPYFTTKSEGTGLGLAICKKIVLEHGGRISLDEQTGGGAAFIIALPCSPGKEGSPP